MQYIREKLVLISPDCKKIAMTDVDENEIIIFNIELNFYYDAKLTSFGKEQARNAQMKLNNIDFGGFVRKLLLIAIVFFHLWSSVYLWSKSGSFF